MFFWKEMKEVSRISAKQRSPLFVPKLVCTDSGVSWRKRFSNVALEVLNFLTVGLQLIIRHFEFWTFCFVVLYSPREFNWMLLLNLDKKREMIQKGWVYIGNVGSMVEYTCNLRGLSWEKLALWKWKRFATAMYTGHNDCVIWGLWAKDSVGRNSICECALSCAQVRVFSLWCQSDQTSGCQFRAINVQTEMPT